MDEFVPLVEVEDLPADLRAQHDGLTRPGLQDFTRLMAHAPEHFRRYNETYAALRFDNHLGPRLTELVRLAVSQTTRCPVCMSGRHPSAIDAGLTEDMVDEIGSDAPELMTPAESAAVRFALKFATDHLSIADADKADLREHFTPEQVVELALLCVMCLVGRFSLLVGIEERACPL